MLAKYNVEKVFQAELTACVKALRPKGKILPPSKGQFDLRMTKKEREAFRSKKPEWGLRDRQGPDHYGFMNDGLYLKSDGKLLQGLFLVNFT